MSIFILAALKEHKLYGKEVMFKDFVTALQSISINIFLIPPRDREKLIGALSRSPKTSIISIPLFLSLYRWWSNESKSANILRTRHTTLQNMNSFHPFSPCLRNDNLIDRIRDLLPVLIYEISSYHCNDTITEIVFNSSLRLCGLILSPADVRYIWLLILKSSGRAIADEDSNQENRTPGAFVTSHDISRFFNPAIDSLVSTVGGNEDKESSSTRMPPSISTLTIPATISDVEVIIPLQRMSVIDEGSIFLDHSDNLVSSESSLRLLCKPPIALNNEAMCQSDTKTRVLSHINAMTIKDKEQFSQRLSCNSKSMATFLLNHTDLFDSLSYYGIHLNQREREEFWSAALSGCSQQSVTGPNESDDAKLTEFFRWISFPEFSPEIPNIVHDASARHVSSDNEFTDAPEMIQRHSDRLKQGTSRGNLISTTSTLSSDEKLCSRKFGVENKPIISEFAKEYSSFDIPIAGYSLSQQCHRTDGAGYQQISRSMRRPSTFSPFSSQIDLGNNFTSQTDVLVLPQSGRRQVLSSSRQSNSNSISSTYDLLSVENPYCGRIGGDNIQGPTARAETDFVGDDEDIRNAGTFLEGDFFQIESTLIHHMQKQLVVLALAFRGLKSTSFNHRKEKLVKCDDFARCLLKAPLALMTSSESAWQLTCIMADIPVNSDPDTATIAYSDVTRYLGENQHYATADIRTDDCTAGTSKSEFVVLHDIHRKSSEVQVIHPDKFQSNCNTDILKNSITRKLHESKEVRGDKIRLLALTPVLRIRLRKSLSAGEIEHSLGICLARELLRLFQSVDVNLSTDEINCLLDAATMKENSSRSPRKRENTDFSQEGIVLSNIILFLADLISQISLPL